MYLTWLSGLLVFLGGLAYLSKGQWLLGLLAPFGLLMVLGGFYFGVVRAGEFRLWSRHTMANSATGLGVVFVFFGAVEMWSGDWRGLLGLAAGLPLFAVGMYFGFILPLRG